MSSRVYVIGIGGPSCSGKTTITRILLKLLKNVTVIYQDDFFKTDNEIPIDPKTKLANWDCPDALRTDDLVSMIQYARDHDGALGPNYKSNEHHNNHDGSGEMSEAQLEELHNLLQDFPSDTHVVLVDGFMLFWEQRLFATFDLVLFVTASQATLKARRENRIGYTTIEGYWADPPHYFDSIVWPNYLRWNQPVLSKEKQSLMDHLLVIDTDTCDVPQAARATVLHLLDSFLNVKLNT